MRSRRPNWAIGGPYWILLLLCIGFVGLGFSDAHAHPIDRLRQHLLIQLGPETLSLNVGFSGGFLATELVAMEIDANGNGIADESEVAAWAKAVVSRLNIQVGSDQISLETAGIGVTVPDLLQFRSGLEPIVISIHAPMPPIPDLEQRRLTVKSGYRVDRTDFQYDVGSNQGVAIDDQGWPGSSIHILFTIDSKAPGHELGLEASERSESKLIGSVQKYFERDRSPSLLAGMIGVFAVMGALHAVQPGHGKALAAAYLVATGGTPRDALALGGIVTLTHTVSVLALGAATLAAGQFFSPTRMIPALEIISGVFVALLGLVMFRRAIHLWNRGTRNDLGSHVATGDDHDHHHDHAYLSDDEHARLHAREALALQSGFSRKGLAALGVSGGMVPCPEALAILLLAIGIGQAGMGMVAIVAFSLGLASTLVAFGLSVVLVKPAMKRLRAGSSSVRSGGWHVFGLVSTTAPLASALVVFLLGSFMLYRAGQGMPLG
ncbi:hypothetical protein BH23CHL5_BH23CHL5_11890 [soil metagenome]